MSNYEGYFSSLMAKDFARMYFGAHIGSGEFREVYQHALNPDIVIKTEGGAGSFSNVREADVWTCVSNTEFAKWFAPVLAISPAGGFLLQRKCEPARRDELPNKVPAFFTDLKQENWGVLDGRVVCMDYGNHLLIERGMTKSMRKADWGR